MFLSTDFSAAKILNLELLQPDPGLIGHAIVRTPFDFQLAGISGLYVIGEGFIRLISFGEIIFLPQNRLRIPLLSIPENGTLIQALCDFNSGLKLDCIDRQLINGHAYVEQSFELTNANDLVEYGAISLISTDLEFSLKWPYPNVAENVSYTNGICSPGLSLFPTYTGALSDIRVFFNSIYLGLLTSKSGNVNTAYTSPKPGKVEFVKQGRLQLSLDGNTWQTMLYINRLLPRAVSLIRVRYDVTSLTQVRYLNDVKIFATEEVT